MVTESKDVITVINMGWDYVAEKMPQTLSIYAARGYKPASMTEKEIRLEKCEPCDKVFFLVKGSSSIVNGELLCSCGEYSMYWADRTASHESEEVTESKARLILQMIISGIGVALIYFFTKERTDTVSAVASGVMAMLAVFFGYSATRLSKIKKKK